MSDPFLKFVPADRSEAPPDGELARAMAALLIDARRGEREQAGDGETAPAEPALEIEK